MKKISLDNLCIAMLGTAEIGNISSGLHQPSHGCYINFKPIKPTKYVFVKKKVYLNVPSKVTDAISSEKYIEFSQSGPGDTCVIILNHFNEVLIKYATDEIKDKHLKDGFLTFDDVIKYTKELNDETIELKEHSHGDINFKEYTASVIAHL